MDQVLFQNDLSTSKTFMYFRWVHLSFNPFIAQAKLTDHLLPPFWLPWCMYLFSPCPTPSLLLEGWGKGFLVAQCRNSPCLYPSRWGRLLVASNDCPMVIIGVCLISTVFKKNSFVFSVFFLHADFYRDAQDTSSNSESLFMYRGLGSPPFWVQADI